MNVADILLVLILAGAFLLGSFQGVVRGLLAICAWLGIVFGALVPQSIREAMD